MSFMLMGGTVSLNDMWRPQTQLDNQILINTDILGYKTLNHVKTIVGMWTTPCPCKLKSAQCDTKTSRPFTDLTRAIFIFYFFINWSLMLMLDPLRNPKQRVLRVTFICFSSHPYSC